ASTIGALASVALRRGWPLSWPPIAGFFAFAALGAWFLIGAILRLRREGPSMPPVDARVDGSAASSRLPRAVAVTVLASAVIGATAASFGLGTAVALLCTSVALARWEHAHATPLLIPIGREQRGPVRFYSPTKEMP